MKDNRMGWISVAMIVWPLVRIGFQYFGLEVPDLGSINELPWQEISMGSTAAGTALLAKSKPIGKKKK